MLDDEGHAPCARCRRSTPVEVLRLWTTREHVRALARAAPPSRLSPREPLDAGERSTATLTEATPRAPAFRYASVTRADAVCPACHARLARGAALDGPERWRTWLTFAIFLAIAAVLVWGIPALTPNLIAAFWRNGAGGR